MKKLKAQQITEFMLTAPLLIMFFVVLTEFAFAFNSYVVLNNALKSSVSESVKFINREWDDSEVEKYVKKYVALDLENNKLPNLTSLKVSLAKVGSTQMVIGSYTYKPGFAFTFLPALKSIEMKAVSVFAFPAQNYSGYKNGINTLTLNAIQPPPPPDSDGDGMPDIFDADDDNDGILDEFDTD